MAERMYNLGKRWAQLTDLTGCAWCGHDDNMKPTADRPYEVIAKEYGWRV